MSDNIRLLINNIWAMTLRVVIAGACVLGIWNSMKVAHADLLFRQDTADSLRAAIGLEPKAWQYYMRLAQLDEVHASQLLETALHFNPFNAQADIELGLRSETEGDRHKAEKFFLQAFAVDNTYVPRWSLAGFYLRQDNVDAFWRWAKKATEMPAENMAALFDLCWHVSTDPGELAAKIISNDPDVIQQYLRFLLRKHQLENAEPIAERLIHTGSRVQDRPLLFAVINQMLSAKDSTAATTLWQSLINLHWVDGSQRLPYNANFARDPLPVDFDWKLLAYPGLRSWPGSSGLETEFTGAEPEDCSIAEQTIGLSAGNYVMKYQYKTAGIPPDTGIHWQIVNTSSNTIEAESSSLSSETTQQSAFSFASKQQSAILILRLAYKRVPGTPRVSGEMTIESIDIQRQP